MLIGFLHRGGLDQWSYAIMADVAAQGADVMRFTSADVDPEKRLIWGEVWYDGRWFKRQFRYPDAIRNFEFRDPDRDTILEHLPYSLGRHLRKNDQLELLSKMDQVAGFIPKTIDFDDTVDILALVQKWGGAILKPARGRLGQGIVFIRCAGQDFELEDNGQRQTLNQVSLQDYLQDFSRKTDRSYVVQQFAATTGPQNRYFNVRIIMQKAGDGDWHPCGVPLSLLARVGSVVCNRETGATNVSLFAVLKKRFGAQSERVLDRLFSAAVLIARALDDALCQQGEELALDMAVNDHGDPWLHEANWRGGFWLLAEDVGLYRRGGANAVRIANRHQFRLDVDVAKATLLSSKNRINAESAKQNGVIVHRFRAQLGADIVLRSDDTLSNVVQLVATDTHWITVSDATSFGSAQRSVGQALAVIAEQSPAHPLPKIVSIAGFCNHDPADERPPRRWIAQELVTSGLISEMEASLGASLSPLFLRRVIAQNRLDLGVQTIDVFLLEGLERHITQDASWQVRWQQTADEMSHYQLEGLCRAWGLCVPYKFWQKNEDRFDALFCHDGRAVPSVLMLEIPPEVQVVELDRLAAIVNKGVFKLMIKVQPLPPRIKPWGVSHRLIPTHMVGQLMASFSEMDVVVFCPVANATELNDFAMLKHSLFEKSSPMPMHTENSSSSMRSEVVQALQSFAQFDPRQIFRFFVDGRFHKTYRGWSGYEENESGSVQGILNAYQLMIGNFDLSKGLSSSYIRNLHIACMSGVVTKNKKTTPGELRYLDAGINLFKGKSTLESIQDLLNQRTGDGSNIFYNPNYQRTAESFTAEEVLQILKNEGRIRYRMWYPNLTTEQKSNLAEPKNLSDFYAVKHAVQKEFAERADRIVDRYNQEDSAARTPAEHLTAISRVVRNLELLHPFPDGNGRTFVAVLMNHLLLSHGFLPAILWDPNIDAELSVPEFVDEIQRGIKNTELLLNDPAAKLYDYAIEEAQPQEIRTFLRMAQGFISKLNALAYGSGEDAADAETNQVFLPLTPSRLVAATGGAWMQIDPQSLAHLRFERVSLGRGRGNKQLLFCRELKTWIEQGKDLMAELQQEIATGVVAFVLDDPEIAQRLSAPVLLVADVDQALFDAGAAARKVVNCRAIAVLGAPGAKDAREMLTQTSKSQLQVHFEAYGECKTPQVMASLANLHRTDQLEIIEVAVGARPNVMRHRLRAIEPDYCLFASSDNGEEPASSAYLDSIKALAACVDGLRDGGLCVLNSGSSGFATLKKEILARRSVAIQTFGNLPENEGRLIEATFDPQLKRWQVTAEILGQSLNYSLHGIKQTLPILSVGVLLVLENLGCDLNEACKAF